jgi:flagellar biogenesis protein FliO
MRHKTGTVMKRRALRMMAGAAIIIFTMSAGLCPLAFAAKTKRHQARQETVKQDKKEDVKAPAGSEENTGAGEEAEKPAKEAAAKAADNGDTSGVPVKEFKDEDFKPQADEDSSAWMLFKMLLVMGLFGGGFYYFYRFVTKKGGVNMFGGEAIKVLSVVSLGQNKFIQIVDLAGKVLVVGVSDGGINLISEITDKDQVDRIRILSTRTPPTADKGAGGGFQDHVMKEIGKVIGRVKELRHRDRGSRAEVIENPADIEYLRRQRSRLKDMNGSDNE